jgi:hypothetical protein
MGKNCVNQSLVVIKTSQCESVKIIYLFLFTSFGHVVQNSNIINFSILYLLLYYTENDIEIVPHSFITKVLNNNNNNNNNNTIQ